MIDSGKRHSQDETLFGNCTSTIDIDIMEMDTNISNSSSYCESEFPILEAIPRGVLDHLHSAISDVSSNMISLVAQHTESPFAYRLVENSSLFLNDFLGIVLIFAVVRAIRKLQYCSWAEIKDMVVEAILALNEKGLEKERDKMESSLKESMWKERKVVTKVLPKDGMDIDLLLKKITSRANIENKRWENGLVSGIVYGGDLNHTNLLNQVYGLYSLSNPFHADIWPSINQCEAEVISMTASLLNGRDENVVGTMTSGGTESIVMTVRAHLKLYGMKRGVENPEIISGVTAHAGLNKACEMFNIRLVQIPCGEGTGYKLDAKEVERCMNMNVIMIYSSAPNYPQGVIDPIVDLSAVAMKYGVGLHVDACLGGFVLPFAKMMDYDIPKFDFGCPGVTSISADTHKYGYATKGTSVILYRNKELRRAQYFTYSKWTGGLYTTPTIAGSRAGGLIVCAWASLMAIGETGFKSRVKRILDATKEIANEISQIKGLKLLGCDPTPHAMIVCFTSTKGSDLDIYQVAEVMTKRHWSLNSLQNPASIHLCVTLKTIEHKEMFINDLRNCVKELLDNPRKIKEGGSAAIYGVCESMPAGPVNELLMVYTDVTLSC